MNIRILEKGNPKDIKAFRSLPFRLYQNNPFWVPPMPGEIETVMSPELHPFYAHSESDFIVLEDNQEILGRLAILHNRNYCDLHQEKTAFFYYFEAVEDPQVVKELFDFAEGWAVKRKLIRIMGPRGFLRSNAMGMLVDGFDQEPAMGILYNFPYYPIMLEHQGFQKYFDHFSGYMDKHPDPIIHKAAEKVLARGNFHIQSFSSFKEMQAWIPRVEEVHHHAFAGNPDYYPSTTAEFDLLVRNIIAVANPRYLKLIMHGDDLAGFIVAYPDLNKALRRSRGNLYPLGWIHLLLAKKFSRVIDMNGIGLLPEYQGLGGNALLYSEIDNVLYDSRFKKAEIIQVDERNFRSKSDMQSMGVIFNKTHRTYIKNINA